MSYHVALVNHRYKRIIDSSGSASNLDLLGSLGWGTTEEEFHFVRRATVESKCGRQVMVSGGRSCLESQNPIAAGRCDVTNVGTWTPPVCQAFNSF